MRTHVIIVENNEPQQILNTGVRWSIQNLSRDVPADNGGEFHLAGSNRMSKTYLAYNYWNYEYRERYQYVIYSDNTDELIVRKEHKIDGIWQTRGSTLKPRFVMRTQTDYLELYGMDERLAAAKPSNGTDWTSALIHF